MTIQSQNYFILFFEVGLPSSIFWTKEGLINNFSGLQLGWCMLHVSTPGLDDSPKNKIESIQGWHQRGQEPWPSRGRA